MILGDFSIAYLLGTFVNKMRTEKYYETNVLKWFMPLKTTLRNINITKKSFHKIHEKKFGFYCTVICCAVCTTLFSVFIYTQIDKILQGNNYFNYYFDYISSTCLFEIKVVQTAQI